MDVIEFLNPLFNYMNNNIQVALNQDSIVSVSHTDETF